MPNIWFVIPFVLFCLVCCSVAFAIRRDASLANFPKEFFAGNYRVGRIAFICCFTALFLATVTIPVSLGASAYSLGHWLPCALALFALLATTALVARKRLINAARKMDAATVLDVLQERFKSGLVTIVVGLCLVFACGVLLTLILASSGYLFSRMTGYSTTLGAALIAATTVLIVVTAGLRGAAVINVASLIVMIASVATTAIVAAVSGVELPLTPEFLATAPIALAPLLPAWAQGVSCLALLAPNVAAASSVLLAASALVAKNLLIGHCEAHHIALTRMQVRRFGEAVTVFIGLAAFAAAFLPYSFLLEVGLPVVAMLFIPSACVMMLALYWKKTNQTGMLIGFICGFLTCGFTFNVIDSLLSLVLTLIMSLAGMMIGSMMHAKQLPEDTESLFFDKR